MSLEAEIKSIKTFFEGSKTVERLRWEDGERSLAFTLHTGKKQLRFQFFVPFGYPDDKSPDERPTLMQEDGLHDDLIEKVNDFARSGQTLVATMQFLVKSFTEQFSLKASRDHSAMSVIQTDKMDVDKKKPSKSKGKKGKKAKKGKKKAESSEEENESEEEYYSDGEGGDFVVGNTKLREDVEETESYFGKDSVKYFPELQMVRLFVDTGFIPAPTAAALGVDCTIPINVSVHFGEEYLSSPYPPKFEIDQKPHNDLFGLQFQLTEITRAWITANWGKTSYSIGAPPPKETATSSKKGGLLSKFWGGDKDKGNDKGKSATPEKEEGTEEAEYAPDKKYPTQLKELMDMGFDRSLAMYALHTSHGSTEEATHLCLDPQPWFVEEAEKIVKSQKQGRKALTQSQVTKGKSNFLIALTTYVRSRIANCSNHCPICDYRHECDGVKPIVCSKPDCVWRYEELGLGANVNAEIARAPEVVDLLISLAVAATASARAEEIFTPFPSDFVDQGSQKNLPKLKGTLENLPPVNELSSQQEIRAYVDKLDPNPSGHKTYYRLIRWLLTSNRAHLIRLPEHLQIQEMSTPYQYMLLTSTPEKEARFAALKKQYGSFMAFHGSPMENWHSILHNGLRNMSNTKGMLHGAAHGAGIYLAPNAGTSQGYMRAGSGWSRSQFGASASCLAMCEVISHSSIYGIDHNQWCYVVKEDDHVMTRFFFIYSGSTSFPTSAIARQLKIPDVTGELGWK